MERVKHIAGHIQISLENDLTPKVTQEECKSREDVPKGEKFSLNDFRIDGRVVLVTGGSRGIGAQIARALSAVGANVVITSRHQDDCDETAKLISDETGNECFGFAADVSSDKDCKNTIDFCVKKFGGLDILIGNAGIASPAMLAETTDDNLNSILDVNLKGQILIIRAAIPHLKKSGHGRIILNSSVASMYGVVEGGVYSATKGGLDALVRVLAKELAEFKITANCFNPGGFATELAHSYARELEVTIDEFFEKLNLGVPLNRFGKLKELAGAIVWLASDLGAYTTGTHIAIDGGLTC